jgi:hypothetical protein
MEAVYYKLLGNKLNDFLQRVEGMQAKESHVVYNRGVVFYVMYGGSEFETDGIMLYVSSFFKIQQNRYEEISYTQYRKITNTFDNLYA